MFAAILGSAILDDAKHALQQQDKWLAGEVQLNACDWSKAKAGVRSLDFHRLLRASKAFQWAVLNAWRAALLSEDAVVSETALLDELDHVAARLAQVRARMVKADLGNAVIKKVVA